MYVTQFPHQTEIADRNFAIGARLFIEYIAIEQAQYKSEETTSTSAGEVKVKVQLFVKDVKKSVRLFDIDVTKTSVGGEKPEVHLHFIMIVCA